MAARLVAESPVVLGLTERSSFSGYSIQVFSNEAHMAFRLQRPPEPWAYFSAIVAKPKMKCRYITSQKAGDGGVILENSLDTVRSKMSVYIQYSIAYLFLIKVQGSNSETVILRVSQVE